MCRLIVEVNIVLLAVRSELPQVNIVMSEANTMLLGLNIVLLGAKIVVPGLHIVLLDIDNMYSGGAHPSHLPIEPPVIVEEERYMSTWVRQWSYTQRASW
jgi:hypothetical protein